MPAILSPRDIFETLARHDVSYVLIGALAGTFHGSPVATQDADICPEASDDNLMRLASALKDMDARIYTSTEPDGLVFACDAAMLKKAGVWNLTTRFGRLDISFVPSGTRGYSDLARRIVLMELDGVPVPVADLLDVIRSKAAANRAKDDRHLPTLRKLLERLNQEEQ